MDKNLALLILSAINILLVYTHYFAWLVVVAQYLWVAFIDRRHLRQITGATVILVLCFLPWVGVIVYVSTKVPITVWDQASWTGPQVCKAYFTVAVLQWWLHIHAVDAWRKRLVSVARVMLGLKNSVLGPRETKPVITRAGNRWRCWHG